MGRSTRGEKYSTTLQIRWLWVQGAILSSTSKWERTCSAGKLGRNVLRGFGATQWDFAVHRDFPIHESLRLQFRTEMFNVLNHPNFGQPDGNLNDATFGFSRNMLGRSLGESNLGSGGFDALYQIGGPRSIQFAVEAVVLKRVRT